MSAVAPTQADGLPDTERWEADGAAIYLAGTSYRIAMVFGPPAILGSEERDCSAVARQAQVYARIMATAPIMLAELRRAAATFREYEHHHRAKPDPVKAERNATLARSIERVLAQADGLAPIEVPA
ncbi:hypothetical protein [Falsiroseomonas sp.]|uniref:hypothetical protein n=1 Tax=Falsiroseomonas sp. TaxID=2870721 RepID=UPI002735FABF|nr:hypothetical protein [Falsiroseomonas sp.]MDP3417885.1 hypothetical protein [Falsiroseomonas sp.]